MVGNRGTDPHLNGANGAGPSGRHRPADPSTDSAPGNVDLQDKVALIVDGTSADGQALALAFAGRGMHVTIICVHDERQAASAIKEQVEAQGRRCLLISWVERSSAASQKQFAEHAMQQIRETFGRLDVFVNLSPPLRPQNGDGLPDEQKPDLRSRLFPHLKLMKAALGEIARSDPD